MPQRSFVERHLLIHLGAITRELLHKFKSNLVEMLSATCKRPLNIWSQDGKDQRHQSQKQVNFLKHINTQFRAITGLPL